MKQIYVFIFLGIGLACKGTSIVCIITPDRVLLAADSKSVLKNDKNEIVDSTEMNKIMAAGSFFFSTSGFETSPLFGYDLPKIVKQCLGTAVELNSSTLELLKRTLGSKLRPLLEYRKKAGDLTSFLKSRNNQLCKLLIVGVQQNSPFACALVCSYSNAASDIAFEDAIYYSKNVGNGPLQYLLLGEQKAITHFLSTGPIVSKTTIHSHIKQLIQMEIHESPKTVGYPIQILEITIKGAQWIKKGNYSITNNPNAQVKVYGLMKYLCSTPARSCIPVTSTLPLKKESGIGER